MKPAMKVSRSSALDRHLAGSEEVIVMGPLTLAPVAALRQRAVAMAVDPATVLGNTRRHRGEDSFERDHVERDHAELGRRLVVDRPDLAPDIIGFGEHARQASQLRPAGEVAVWVVAGGWLTLVVDHVVGDAAAMNSLATSLVSGSAGGSGPAVAVTGDRWLLARALMHTYGRHPDRLVGAVRAVWRSRQRGSLPVQVAGRRAERSSAVHAIAGEEGTAALRAWQREAGRGVSPLAVHTLLVHRAVRREGIGLGRQVLVLFDARAHLPAGVVASGNFGVGVGIDVGAPSSLTVADAALREAFEVGRPLTAMAAGALGSVAGPILRGVRGVRGVRAVRGPRPDPSGGPVNASEGPTTADATGEGEALLIVTALGRDPQVEALPWAGTPGERVFSAVSAPSPGAITLAVTFLDGRRQYSLSFDPDRFDAASLARALDTVAHDPVSLLADS